MDQMNGIRMNPRRPSRGPAALIVSSEPTGVPATEKKASDARPILREGKVWMGGDGGWDGIAGIGVGMGFGCVSDRVAATEHSITRHGGVCHS